MLLSEYGFFLFIGLALSKVNCLLRFFWDNINHTISWLSDFAFQWLMMGDMFSWLDNRARVWEAVLLGSVVMIIVVFFDDYFGLKSTAIMCSAEDCNKALGFQFGYRRLNGPAKWKEHYENALGSMQSPINIITCDAVMVKSAPLNWSNHDNIPENMIMHNDGYSVVIQGVWKNKKPQITGEALENVNYVFNRLYFHWGPTDTEGSEHTINYERYPLELHAIYLKEGYATPMHAHYDGCRNGMLIIAFLFEIAPVDNPSFLHTVTENLHKIHSPKSRCYIEPFPLTDIFPEFSHSYFKYHGSITQPPCSEIVKYIVQTETIAVSRRQMAMFRKLTAFDGKPMMNNSRPVQKLNDRTKMCTDSFWFLGSIGNKAEYILMWVSCSVVLAVAAMQLLNNEIDMRTPMNRSQQTVHETGPKDHGSLKFGYGKDDGPHLWYKKYRRCAGKKQSPIDLDTTTSVIKYQPHLYWWNYHRKPSSILLENNGHNAKLLPEWDNPDDIPCFWPSIGNYSYKEENYLFSQLHFHWGPNNTVGSEHTINSISYPLEMHVVHRKRKYRNALEALEDGEGNLLVIAILFQVSKHVNEALTPITSALKSITKAGTKVQVVPFDLRGLLPEFSSYFLMYSGSLTTPPCNEGVVWVVKLETSTISHEQLHQFRSLWTDKNEPMLDNYRPVQPLNGRSVWHIK